MVEMEIEAIIGPPGNCRHYSHRSGDGHANPYDTPGGGDLGSQDDPYRCSDSFSSS